MPPKYSSDELATELLADEGGSFLRLVGGVLDAPGSTIRNTLALRNPLRGLFNLEDRLSGRDLLERIGLPKNTPGLDTGDVLGFIAEVGLDPLTYLTLGTGALTKSGKVAKQAGLMPKDTIDLVTGRLVQGKGRRLQSRTTTLAEALAEADPLQRQAAERAAAAMGVDIGKLAESTEPLQRDIGISIPFGPEIGTFNLPGGKGFADYRDYLADTWRASRPGQFATRLFSKPARSAATLRVQNAMQDASVHVRKGKDFGRLQAADTRLAIEKMGMTQDEYGRFMRGALEEVDPETARRAPSLAVAIEKNLPERLRTPENINDLTTRLEGITKDKDFSFSLLRDSGRAPAKTQELFTRFHPRLATDKPNIRGYETVSQLQERGARTFVDMPGGSNTIIDAMNDENLWGMMQNAFRERDLAAAARPQQLAALQGMGVEDLDDLTRSQATKMIAQGKMPGEVPSRTQAPPNLYATDIPTEVSEYVARKYFKWGDGDFEVLNQFKGKDLSQLDDVQRAMVESLKDQMEKANVLARGVGARPEELVRSKVRYYNNDPLVDWLAYREHAIEQSQYAKQLYTLMAGNAIRGMAGELKPTAIPEGYVPLKDALRQVITPLSARKDPGKWRPSVGMSYAIKAIAPDLAKYKVIDDEVLERMVGEHAVYDSAIESVRLNADELGVDPSVVAGAQKYLDELGAAQELKYDGLLALNQIYVPKDIMADATRVMDTLSDRGYMRDILKGYDKALNLSKAHLTVPFPGFHVRNGYNMIWQMIVSGSYDPDYARFNPMAYLSPLRDAAKIVRGEAVEGAAKYFPGQNLTDAEAINELRKMAFAHNTATGQFVFHSESADVVGPGGPALVPDLIRHMPGTVPEGQPGAAGLGYLWEGWKKLWKGDPAEKNPLNVMGVMDDARGKKFGPYEGGLKAATYIESVGRTATMMAKMKQGWRPDLAAAASNAAHVAYDSLSTFERQVMKRLLPWYSYGSRMVPWTLRNLAENPGGLTAQTIRAFEGAKGEGGFVPEYLRGSLSIPIGGEDERGRQTFMTGVDLPFESLNDYIQYGPDAMSTVSRTLRQIGGQMSPYLQAPIELSMGQTFYQGRNLKDLDPALGRLAANIVGSEDPLFSTPLLDQVIMKSPLSRYFATVRTLSDRRDPISEQLYKKPLQIGTGVRFKDVDMEQQENFAILDAIKDQARGDRPFVTGDYITVRKENLPKLSDRQRELLELYRERSARLRKG